MQWTWDEAKNRTNQIKHGLNFETAQYVFTDPLALSIADPHPQEERWQTIGLIGSMVVFVVHTYPESESECGRIISARQATPHEKRIYEEETY